MKFKMVPETLYTTINYIDRFLEASQVRRSRLQLAGVACLLVCLYFTTLFLFLLLNLTHSECFSNYYF